MKERRRDPRIREENKVIFSVIPTGESQEPEKVFHSLTKDISMGGFRIMTDAALAVDSRVRVEIVLAKSRKRIQAVARVRWTKELFGKDVYDTGFEFVEIDPAAELVLIDHIYGKTGPKV
jgi:c-di-GMP-binding flagellar brake protein YcgR